MNVPRQLAVFNIFCFQTFPKQQKRPTLTSLILCVNKYIFKLRRIYNIFRITKGSFNARSSLVPRLRTAVLGDGMGVGRIFSRGGDSRGFSQNFSRGSQNNGEFVFYSSKLKKQPFFAKHFKIQEGTLAPPAPLPTPMGVVCFNMRGRDAPCFIQTMHILFLFIFLANPLQLCVVYASCTERIKRGLFVCSKEYIFIFMSEGEYIYMQQCMSACEYIYMQQCMTACEYIYMQQCMSACELMLDCCDVTSVMCNWWLCANMFF